MNLDHLFQKRIDYQASLKEPFLQICSDYRIGKYLSHQIIPVGYEDLNIALETNKGKYFVKIFSAARSYKECQRCVDLMLAVITAGVQHPQLYQSKKGYLYTLQKNGGQLRLCLMQYLDGQTFYQSASYPSQKEIRFLAKQAALINKIKYLPSPRYYRWAVINFLKEYHSKKHCLTKKDNVLFSKLVNQVKLIPSFKKFPRSLVHGDIIRANIIKNKSGKLFIIDFSSADYYSRLQEIAVILSDLLFDENRLEYFQKSYQIFLAEYQKHLPLTPLETKYLPLFTQCAHAINILNPRYYKVVKKNNSQENEYWIRRGRAGLQFTLENFSS